VKAILKKKSLTKRGMTQMKHLFATALVATACLMPHTGALAQNKLEATIPFDFTVGQSQLPAGTYMVTYVQPRVIEFSNWQKNVNVMTLITSTADVKQTPNSLVFNKYGDQYFLSEVRGGYGGSAAKVGTSKREKRVQVEEAALANQQKSLIAMK
jgi:hypothetical protein